MPQYELSLIVRTLARVSAKNGIITIVTCIIAQTKHCHSTHCQ